MRAHLTPALLALAALTAATAAPAAEARPAPPRSGPITPKELSPARVPIDQPGPAEPPPPDRSGRTLKGLAPLSATTARAALDVDKVSALVADRLAVVRDRALRDALDHLGSAYDVAPIRDLAHTLPTLLLPGSDPAGRSQTLHALTLRLGLSAAFATLLAPPDPQDKPRQRAIRFLRAWDAAYEGLARSLAAEALGFSEATGKVPAELVPLARRVTLAADALAREPLTPILLAAAPLTPRARALSANCGATLADDPLYKDFVAAVAELGRRHATEAATAACADAWDAAHAAVDPRVATATHPLSAFDAAAAALTAAGLDAPADARRARWLLIARSILDRPSLTRADVDLIADLAGEYVALLAMHEALREALTAFFDELPLAVREEIDANGVVTGLVLDVTALGEGLVERHAWADREGLYLRATVGTGYLSVISGDARTGLQPAVYEELGAGYRWGFSEGRLLVGPHLAVSGVLHRFVLDDEVEDGVFAIAGVALNLYQAIDVSAGAGWIVHAADDEQEGAWMVVAGLQVPLIEYLTADDE